MNKTIRFGQIRDGKYIFGLMLLRVLSKVFSRYRLFLKVLNTLKILKLINLIKLINRVVLYSGI